MKTPRDFAADSLSIVIPVLNDAGYLARLLPYLTELAPGSEIIISDGGSTDDSVALAGKFGTVIRAPRGRGQQLNAGASKATRDIVWFLHADCMPHRDSVREIETVMADGSFVAGGFEYEFFEKGRPYRFFAWYSNRKNQLKRQIYGDMGLFMHRAMFFELGGFRQHCLMEDFDFGRRLRRAGKVAILPQRIVTSSRDWQRHGVVVKIIKDALIRMAFLMKADERMLYRWYYGKTHELEA